jgi:hypothetical protein
MVPGVPMVAEFKRIHSEPGAFVFVLALGTLKHVEHL